MCSEMSLSLDPKPCLQLRKADALGEHDRVPASALLTVHAESRERVPFAGSAPLEDPD